MISYIKRREFDSDIEDRLIQAVSKYPNGALDRFYQTMDNRVSQMMGGR